MSYTKKNSYDGQYIEVAALGADDPWADAASGEVADMSKVHTEGPGLFDFLFGGAGSSTPKPTTTATKPPSTVSQVGAGVGAFLSNLGKPQTPIGTPGMPVTPYRPGMSSTTKLALVGGGALLLVLLLTRD
jgi:hypothetical protein